MAKKPTKQSEDIDNDPMFATTREGANDIRLRLFLERIERIREEKKGLADDEKDVFTELKSSGFDAKTARRMLILRKMEKDARDEMLHLEQTYMAELGIGI